jgi:hypothetical protein
MTMATCDQCSEPVEYSVTRYTPEGERASLCADHLLIYAYDRADTLERYMTEVVAKVMRDYGFDGTTKEDTPSQEVVAHVVNIREMFLTPILNSVSDAANVVEEIHDSAAEIVLALRVYLRYAANLPEDYLDDKE